MAKQWRPVEVLNALKRLGFLDRPSVGDHVTLFKSLEGHAEGAITIQTGVDTGTSPCSKYDVSRIQRQTKLKGDMWARAMDKKLTRANYDEYLREYPKSELVLHFWRSKFEKKPAPKKKQRE